MRRLPPFLLLLLGLLATAAPATAAVEAADLADQLDGGVLVEPGADADAGDLQAVVEEHGDVAIVVLDIDGPVEDLAHELYAELGRTVVVFSDTDLGIAGPYDDAEIDAAIEAAGNAARSADEAVAADAILDELTAEPTPVWIPVVGFLVLAVLVGLAGRAWEGRRRRKRDAAALEQLKADLRRRLQVVADRIIDLEPRVQIAGDREAADEFAAASRSYTDVQDRYAAAPTRAAVERLASQLTSAEQALDRVEAAVDR